MTTDTEKLTLLIGILKTFAEAKTCYDVYGDDYTPSADSYDTAFEDGGDYGEIHLARTLLEQIGVEFEYPCMKENTVLNPDQEVLLEQWLEARKACQATYEVNCQADGERSRAQVACFEAGFDPYDYLTGDDLKQYESIVYPTQPGG